MEPTDKRFSEFVDTLKSWMLRRSEPANVSRDFWMPDHSCRVCYECDSQFTIFNRRHHCRLCGRVFCAKCTANSVPVSPDDPKNSREEWERIRVCNYCFKQWGQDVPLADNGAQVSSPVLSPSISTTSLVSTKSSGTGNSSITTAASTSHSAPTFQRASYVFVPSPSHTVQIEQCTDKQAMMISGGNIDSAMDASDVGNSSSNQLAFCINRSDDEDEDYGACRSDSESQHFQHFGDYYGPAEFGDVDRGYSSNKVHPAVENIDAMEIGSPICHDTEFHTSLGVDKLAEAERVNSFDCDASSTIYRMEGTDVDSVDFEKSKLLWLPPEPEDEEDEKEASLFDDDDEDATGEWGYLRSSNSFGSGEFRSRDRSTEEHKKAMKNVVDGHFRALVAQLLQVENIPMGDEEDKESWLEIITSLSWEAASLLKPDTSKGGGMDPGGYVKVKCIACGHRSESMVVKGVVCKKNIAHRRMASKMIKPRFLILGGALEYHRVTNQLSSFDTLLQQEMDHLKMAVAKIEAHHPNVLLVEKSVSRFAQDYLLERNISLVLNIKRPLLERIARCTGAQIVPSIDHLSSPKLGHCELFHVEKFLEEHGSADQKGKKLLKTLMFFEGCPRPLGCTILLKGSNGDELKKVKHVVQYGVFAAYHLALETSFLADEGASLPELPLKSPINVALPDKPSSIDRSISTIPGFAISTSGKPLGNDIQRPRTLDCNLTSASNEKMEVMLPSHSSGIVGSKCSQPPHSVITDPCSNMNDFTFQNYNEECGFEPQIRSAARENSKVGFVEHVEAKTFRSHDEANAYNPTARFRHIDSLETFEVGDHTHVDDNQMIEKQDGSSVGWSSYQHGNQKDEHKWSKEEFPPSPSDHQSILVSLSTRCVWKGTVCERPHLFRIKYYGSFDKPLGRFLRDHLFDQSFRCRSCEMPSEAHVHCYTHRQGSLTISVRKQPDVHLPGERDGKIWMWHRCLRCPRVNGLPPATRRVVMSDAAWGLSFGKFLELSFSNHAAASRVASCGHSLHRDCLRFYGFGKMIACFRYASINVHSVYLPPPKLDFSCQQQERIQKEADEVADKAELLFSEVLNSICKIAEKKPDTGTVNGGNMKVVESRRHAVDLELMLQKEKAEFEESFQKLVKREGDKGQLMFDILELNKLRRQLLFQSFLWDQRLILASGSQNRLHEVPNIFLTRNKNSVEKFVDLNLSPKPLGTSISLDAAIPDSRTGNFLKERIDLVDQQGSFIDPPKQPSLEQDHLHGRQSKNHLPSSVSSNDKLDPLESDLAIRRTASDGQFPTVDYLSDTLDAKWTGENSNLLSEASIQNSSVLLETATSVSAPEDLDEKSGSDVNQPFSSAWPSRYGDIIEDSSSLIRLPFLNFYRSINKNSVTSPKFDLFSEYNPVYISLYRELVRQGEARLLLPVGVNDIVIPIYDDEPTSVISYALVSSDYHAQVSDERDRVKDAGDSVLSLPSFDYGSLNPFQLVDEIGSESFKSINSTDDGLLSMAGRRNSLLSDPLAYTKAMHVRVSFTDDGPPGKVKYSVTCYYAKCFDALRRICCPSELDFIRSLSRCKKWGAQGGKSNAFFAKSLDDRFIIKQVSKTELESFIKFAPEYFKYLTESIATGSSTCLAKILGIYQVTKHVKGGKETKMDVLVMENLLFGRNVTRLYDLKGSLRSRYNPDSSGNNKVLLDQNLLETMPTSPIFVGNKAKRLLERAVWNDTAFLASIDVMDYSLLVGVDEERHELVLGIIDFMRQYTWDKHLETWVKSSGILGGQRNVSPTVISPKQYKKRFRKAMSAYFLMVPDQWSPSAIIPSRSQSNLCEDNPQVVSES